MFIVPTMKRHEIVVMKIRLGANNDKHEVDEGMGNYGRTLHVMLR